MLRLRNRQLGKFFRGGRLGIEALEQRNLLSATPPTVTGVFVGSTEWSPAFYEYLAPGDPPNLGYQIPVGSNAQVKSLPWVNIDKITLQFSEDVHVKVGDLSLSGVNSPAIAFEHFFYDAATHIATWTLAAPLPKNSYQIDLNGQGLGAVTDLNGNVLDGEWTNNNDVFPSGDGVAGGDFQFNLRVMPGDVNQNLAVETLDVSAVTLRVGAGTTASNYSPFADVNGSGEIALDDLLEVQARVWSTYPSQGPVGLYNDAPSTTGGGAVSVSDVTGDVSISLFDDFADVETPDNQLVFEIIGNSNPTLFDTAAINSSSGLLTFNAATGQSGRSIVTVRATDSAGLSTTADYVVDVNYENQSPWLDFDVLHVGDCTFQIIGYVVDELDTLEGMYVDFTGAYSGRASVHADGSFSFAVIVSEEHWGDVRATVTDLQGLTSFEVQRSIEIS